MDDILKHIKNPSEVKSYAHFDYRTSVNQCIKKISDPSFVSSYAFYPLIERPMRRIKEIDGVFKNDPRPIRYSAHLDRCIYKYYSACLNLMYNDLANRLNIDDASIAYRTNKNGMSNCEFAALAFNKIRNLSSCYVYAGDFKKFFETLNHAYLKLQFKQLFSDGTIPLNYYKVLKSATQYSYWPIKDLLEYHGLPCSDKRIPYSSLRKLNQKNRVLEPSEFRRLVKDKVILPYIKQEEKGIPQGLPVSGVLANIHMLDFDKEINEIATSFNGLYMRYSDDFIIIIPNEDDFRFVYDAVNRTLNKIPDLIIHPDKTNFYKCSPGKVMKLLDDGEKTSTIDYLGFNYDGDAVRIRQSTICRYYKKIYHMIHLIKKSRKKNRTWHCKKSITRLYLNYTNWGKYPQRNKYIKERCKIYNKHGNFLTYADKAVKAFPEDPISKDVKNVKKKIRKRMK